MTDLFEHYRLTLPQARTTLDRVDAVRTRIGWSCADGRPIAEITPASPTKSLRMSADW